MRLLLLFYMVTEVSLNLFKFLIVLHYYIYSVMIWYILEVLVAGVMSHVTQH
jgi:hypothetical protein